MASEVIPFGKYKGQPVEAMAADQQYIEWLMGQAWFRDKYQNIYTLIVNNFTEPSETPEHNALQSLFLNDDYCLAVVSNGYPRDIVRDDQFGSYVDRVLRDGRVLYYSNLRNPVQDEKLQFFRELSVQFEVNGADVVIEALLGLRSDRDTSIEARPRDGDYSRRVDMYVRNKWWVEIKPSIGDDYPAVLRQMRNTRCSGSPILFVGEYNGVGATKEQFVEIFRRANISVVFRGDAS